MKEIYFTFCQALQHHIGTTLLTFWTHPLDKGSRVGMATIVPQYKEFKETLFIVPKKLSFKEFIQSSHSKSFTLFVKGTFSLLKDSILCGYVGHSFLLLIGNIIIGDCYYLVFGRGLKVIAIAYIPG